MHAPTSEVDCNRMIYLLYVLSVCSSAIVVEGAGLASVTTSTVIARRRAPGRPVRGGGGGRGEGGREELLKLDWHITMYFFFSCFLLYSCLIC